MEADLEPAGGTLEGLEDRDPTASGAAGHAHAGTLPAAPRGPPAVVCGGPVWRVGGSGGDTGEMPVRMFAFLRAINTGGRRLTNDQLLEPFRTAGLDGVGAYQAAGNVAFLADRPPVELEVQLTGMLSDAYGFEVPVFVRRADELRARMTESPITSDDVATTEGRTQVTFMGFAPSAAQVADVMALVPAEDRVVFVEREWFWLPRAGVSDSALPVGRIERIVGPMTMRTVGTVQRMLTRFES